jgi:DNA-binding protein Fis
MIVSPGLEDFHAGLTAPVMRQVGGNQSEAARMPGVSRVTVWRRIKRYGIDLATEVD